MADRPLAFASDAELEALLRGIAGEVEFPSTPDLAAAVRARVVAGQAQPRTQWWTSPWPRALVTVVVLVVVLAGAALLAVPDLREAVADRLGLRGVAITHVEEIATPTPAPTATPAPTNVPTPTPPPPGAALGLGSRVTLDAARAQAGFQLLLPSQFGDPDAVYSPAPSQVSLVWAPRAGLPRAPQSASVGLLLSELRARLDETLFQKGVPPNATLLEVRVAGNRGFWISGAPHTFFYRDASGDLHDERSRLAGNTLLWTQNGVTYRLESALDRDDAIRIAESLR